MRGIRDVRRHAEALRSHETALQALQAGTVGHLLKAIPSALDTLANDLDQAAAVTAITVNEDPFTDVRLQEPKTPADEALLRRFVVNKLLALKKDLRATTCASAALLYNKASKTHPKLPERSALSRRHRSMLVEAFGHGELWIVDPEVREQTLSRLEGNTTEFGPWDLLRMYIGFRELQDDALAQLVTVLNERRHDLDAELGITADHIQWGHDQAKNHSDGLLEETESTELQEASQRMKEYMRFLKSQYHLLGHMRTLRAYRDGVNAMEIVESLKREVAEVLKQNEKLKQLIDKREMELEQLLDSRKSSSVALRLQAELHEAVRDKDILDEELRRIEAEFAELKAKNARLHDEVAVCRVELEERKSIIVKQRKAADQGVIDGQRKRNEIEATLGYLRSNQDFLATVFRKAELDSQELQIMMSNQRAEAEYLRKEADKWQRDRVEIEVESKRRVKMVKLVTGALLVSRKFEKDVRARLQEAERKSQDALENETKALQLRDSAFVQMEELGETIQELKLTLAKKEKEGHSLRARLAASQHENEVMAKELAQLKQEKRKLIIANLRRS